MTKKHFIALADALRDTIPREREGVIDSAAVLERYAQWTRDIEAIADVCAGANGLFKRGRWIDYIMGECGPSGGAR